MLAVAIGSSALGITSAAAIGIATAGAGYYGMQKIQSTKINSETQIDPIERTESIVKETNEQELLGARKQITNEKLTELKQIYVKEGIKGCKNLISDFAEEIAKHEQTNHEMNSKFQPRDKTNIEQDLYSHAEQICPEETGNTSPNLDIEKKLRSYARAMVELEIKTKQKLLTVSRKSNLERVVSKKSSQTTNLENKIIIASGYNLLK